MAKSRTARHLDAATGGGAHARRPGRQHPNGDLSELVGAAQAGDRQAFGELYGRYAGLVHAIAASRVSIDEASDVVQEVFLRALRKVKGLRNAAAFCSWIVAITRNTVRDLEERVHHHVDYEHEPARRETQHDEMAARAAVRAIRALPVSYRNTMRMRLVEGMTGREIADRTGLSVASVRVNLHRGMKLLRARLGTPGRTMKKRSRR
jgi:RNA polymerase sigma-70 factor (ECF subfamily)